MPLDQRPPIPSVVRLVYKTLLDGRFHVYTSPDVRGLHASSETKAGAQRQAIAILDAFVAHDETEKPVVIFDDAPGMLAAE